MTVDYDVYKEGGILNERYQKIEDISEGSYGFVSLAKDIQKKKLVAIKYIFKVDSEEVEHIEEEQDQDEDQKSLESTTSSQEKRVQLVKRRKSLISSNVKSRLSENICFEAIYEIDIQTKIGNDHKNIVKLLDFFDSYIVLEYCSGGDLYEAIKNDLIPRKTKKITHILLQIIEAIQYVHSKNIYHRDIKPENILISNLFDWTIKLSDWGLATTHQKSLDRNVGSERYMAPELFESNLDIQERKEPYQCAKIDVWSIGIVFLNIVFSKNPFSVANQSDKSFCYFAANREALFDVFSTMSLDFFQVLRHSLTIDPTNRDMQNMKMELLNLSEYTLDDDYYNTLEDEDIAISDEENHPIPTYIPPSSAPVPVSLPTPMSSSINKINIKINQSQNIAIAKNSLPSSSKNTDNDNDNNNHKNNASSTSTNTTASTTSTTTTTTTTTTPITAGSTPEEKERAKSVPKFKFQKRSHLQKGNNINANKDNSKLIKNNNNNNRQNYYNNNQKPKIIKHTRKPLGIPTPNTHINDFFNDYNKTRDDHSNIDQNGFNTRDFFTPPSVYTKYMEGIFSHNQTNKQNQKHHYSANNNKSWNKNSSNDKQKRSSTSNSSNKLFISKVKQSPSTNTSNSLPVQHSPGKYIPPNARSYYGSQFYSNSPNVPDIATVLNATTFHEQYTSMDTHNNNNANGRGDATGAAIDLEDVLFTLEENNHDFIHDINNLSLHEPQPHHHAVPAAVSTRSDLPDLLKSPLSKEQQLSATDNPFANQLLHPNGMTKQHRRTISSEHKYKPGVYVPPHHRKSSNSPPASANEATLSVANNSLNYSTSFNSKHSSVNAEPSKSYQRSFMAPLPNHAATTTALQRGDIFAHTDNDALIFSDDDDDDESDIDSHPDARTMFGPYEIYNNNSAQLGKLRAQRKSSALQEEAVGSLEQYKNNWLMLQQQQD